MEPRTVPAALRTLLERSQDTALVLAPTAAVPPALVEGLERLGYAVEPEDDAAAVVARCALRAPALVVVYTTGAALDACEAVRRLRALDADHALPILALFDDADEGVLAQALAAGVDDFLVQPLGLRVLEAKVAVMRRVADLRARVRELHLRRLHDEEIATAVYARAIGERNLDCSAIRALVDPDGRLSGDLYLSMRAPSGDVYVLLGDFSTRGLAAAIGALPASEVFRAMTAKGFAPEAILQGINAKLRALLPTGMFMAAQFVAIDATLDHVRIANCGMPPIWLAGADGRLEGFPPQALALGVEEDLSLPDGLATRAIEPGARVLLNAVHMRGAAHAHDATLELLNLRRAAARGLSMMRALQADFARAGSARYGHEDFAAVEIDCAPALFAETSAQAARGAAPPAVTASPGCAGKRRWTLEFALEGGQLRDTDPIPLLLNHIRELSNGALDCAALFTILTELYVNALDHGVLELPSTLKCGSDGFARYMAERARRLAALESGWVRIAIAVTPAPDDYDVRVTVSDSGNGFDVRNLDSTETDDPTRPYGRGLPLLHALCNSIEIRGSGNETSVTYRSH
ncbi:MAG: SpoIIE family protein phosphatase [Gammaproteobacteria bacterium]|nr:SpoIIE family protein phosphatase [Gammaproteobacteria bacterium]